MANEKMKMRDLVLETLKQVGCQPEVNDADQIVFMFQGSRFFIDADNNSPFIQIYQTWWASIGSTNPDAEKLKVIINQVNNNAFPTVLYSIDEEHQAMGVHCRLRTVFTQDLPELGEFLRALLQSFFQANQAVDHLMKEATGATDTDPQGPAAPQATPGSSTSVN